MSDQDFKNGSFKEIMISAFAIALIFLVTSFFVDSNIKFLEYYLSEHSSYGQAIYVLVEIATTVLAPLSSVPLIPVASSLWGWQATSLLNIFSWVVGSIIAFYIARAYGRPIVRKIVSLEKLEKFEDKIPKEHLFWTIVFLRITIPVDILSYALGIFSKVNYKIYTLATLIGVSPFAVIFSYIGTISLKNQAVIFSFAFLVAILAFFVRKKLNKARSFVCCLCAIMLYMLYSY